jgi:hypothetical protein
MLYNLFKPEVKYRLPITIIASVTEPKIYLSALRSRKSELRRRLRIVS